jgi:mannose-6-phosphate isomerase-like protein (cupin superfamily)
LTHPSLSRLAILVMLGTLLAVLLPLSAQARQSYRTGTDAKASALAHVRTIQRGLTVQPPKKRAVAGKKKMPLYNQYFLRTKRKQRASLAFKDGTILHMNQQTDAILSDHITRVKKGEVDEVVSPGTDHRVQTATAVAGAIGTEFDVREIPAKLKITTAKKGKKRKKTEKKVRARTVFTVVEGSLLVENRKGSVVVKADQQTTVIKG